MKPYGLKQKKTPVYPFGMNFKSKKSERQAAKNMMKLAEAQRDIEPEIAAIVNKHFWELI